MSTRTVSSSTAVSEPLAQQKPAAAGGYLEGAEGGGRCATPRSPPRQHATGGGDRRPSFLAATSCAAGAAAPAHQLLSEEELAAQDEAEVHYRITLLEEEMGAMEVDLEAIAKYCAKDGEYAERARDLEAATALRDEVRWGGFSGGCEAASAGWREWGEGDG